METESKINSNFKMKQAQNTHTQIHIKVSSFCSLCPITHIKVNEFNISFVLFFNINEK